MVYVKLYGRLGNLLFQYGAALSLGRGRAIGVTGDPQTLSAIRSYGQLFAGLRIVPHAPDGCEVFRQDKCNVLKFPDVGDRDVLIDGYFQSEFYLDEQLIRSAFAAEPGRLERLRGKYADILGKPHVTSVHVRRGDYLKLAQYHPFVGERYLKGCLARVPECRDFLVFGDDVPWSRKFFAGNFPDCHFVYSEETDPVDDLYLMSLCRNHIMSNSSFSWWGAWLDPRREKKVFAPSLWFGYALNPHGSVDWSSIYFSGVQVVRNRYSMSLLVHAFLSSVRLGIERKMRKLWTHLPNRRRNDRRPSLPSADFCCGCSACLDACPFGAISMRPDRFGFLRPIVEVDKCRSCGACERVCPVLGPKNPRRPLAAYAARLSDAPETLRESSSGGLFSAFAEKTLDDGGSVFGAVWSDSWSVVHCIAERREEIRPMRGSKYLQSHMDGIYRQVRECLLRKRPVLFTGTPCQVSALRRFLGSDADAVLTVEVICHGVSNDFLLRKYLRQFPGELNGVSFRDKTLGWPRSLTVLRYRDRPERKIDFNWFTCAFTMELCNRESCAHCPTRGLSSGADLTIGDFGGIEQYHPEMNDGRGVSCVLVNTVHGAHAFDSVRGRCETADATYEQVLARNPNLVRSFPPHPLREIFLQGICEERPWDNWTRTCLESRGLGELLMKVRQLGIRFRHGGGDL